MRQKRQETGEASRRSAKPREEKRTSQEELHKRLEKMKSDMRDYEKRMADTWKPPCVLSGLQKPEEFLREKRIKKPAFRAKSDCESPPAEPEVLESKYLQRISFIRSSLESKKREIRHLLTSPDQSLDRVFDMPLTYSKVNTTESNSRGAFEGTFPVLDRKNRHFEAAPRLDFSEITELKSEQARLRMDIMDIRGRMTELERRTTDMPFGPADEEENCSSSGKDSKRTSCSRYSFGKPVHRHSETQGNDPETLQIADKFV